MNLLGIHIFFGLCVAAITLIKNSRDNFKAYLDNATDERAQLRMDVL